MVYQHQMIKLLKELEEDVVITNPASRGRTYLRRLVFKLRLFFSRILTGFKRR